MCSTSGDIAMRSLNLEIFV